MKCPFMELFKRSVDCVYCENGKCDDIEINTGNSDAWCVQKIAETTDIEYITEE